MSMLESLDLLLMGSAVVIDTLLLLIVCERANRLKTADWLRVLTFGLWFVHAATFLRLIIHGTQGWFWLQADRTCLIFLTLGFLLLPSAMLHAALRLQRTGVEPSPLWDSRYAWLYAPMLVLPMAVWLIWHSNSRNYFETIHPILWPYIFWLIAANAGSALLFWRLRKRLDLPVPSDSSSSSPWHSLS